MLLRSPQHDHAPKYARSGLFKALDSFAELERRIAQLPTEKERGDAFEVFAEAYLSTDEMVQAAEVWVIGKVPAEIRRKLNLPSRDYGYDGVFQTKLGELVPYQVKFRTGRTPHPYADLATFFGISEKAERRVVLTNSIAISAVAESRTNFQTTRGGDFDRLDPAQLDAIAAWIDGIAPAPLVRAPRPHQRAALTDIERELSVSDRATVVMACGTGKTLVALWAAEAAQATRVLVLVPSLNLLRQTLHEWAKWTNWGERFRYLCVCSDPKVSKGLDEIEVRPADADFPVRTDPAIVRKFLADGGDTVSVVFCTYQSAPVVGEAMKKRQPFDLGIFDEAHKTTGREGTRYAYALRDSNLPIRKRLFLTATPRHYNIGKRDKEGDFEVASMDDEAIYGRVAHRLTFAQAAAQKIIVPYKVVISVVDSEMIDNALMDKGEVSIKGDPVRAKWVAHQIALKRAVEEHDLKRLITFHSSIKAAAAFASDDSEGVGIHLPDFQRFHVSGAQPTAERDEHMHEFARAQRGVITNARCLTEGVDVPTVDMVAFMNPRKSRVDIVQAVGRAMRNAPDKDCGYVLVPLFLEMRKGETLDEALERSGFDEIAQVLNALRENDDELSDIIQGLTVDRGRTGGFDESRLREKIEVLAPQVRLSELARSICIRLVEELGVSWDERYGQLVAYNQSHGDCNVPQRWKDNPKLGTWCNMQRTLYKNHKISPDRTKRLEHLGFAWDPLDANWAEMFAALIAHKQIHGDCNVPQRWQDNPELGRWCATQRKANKSNKLAPGRVTLLAELGFSWDLLADNWETMFAALKNYKQTHGDCNVSTGDLKNKELGGWVAEQRTTYTKGILDKSRKAQLDEIGFVWDTRDETWEKRFSELIKYKNKNGDCGVPFDWPENRGLSRWVVTQRQDKKKNHLDSEKASRLTEIGFDWNRLESDWKKNFSALSEFFGQKGHLDVPEKWPKRPGLRGWVNKQRESYKKGNMREDRIAMLSKLGFVWAPLDESWNIRYAELVEFKKTFGHCDIRERDNLKLAQWATDLRKRKRGRTELSPERLAQLNALGFVWDTREAAWDEMFEALSDYIALHGDSNVPATWPENESLGYWVAAQRAAKKSGQISEEHVARLNAINFSWDRFDDKWERSFRTLIEYKNKYGNCNVPQKWKGNPSLGKWVSDQRKKWRDKTLKSEHQERLEMLGFTWQPKNL